MPFSIVGPDEPVQYGCIFCPTGKERTIAQALEQIDANLRVTVAVQTKHRSMDGVKSLYSQILLPGYIFFMTTNSFTQIPNMAVCGAYRCLKGLDGNWRLTGHDRQFAEWVFDNNGVIGVSKISFEGGAVRIVSGPLKEYEGNIVKINKRSRNCLVELNFNQRVWRIWLAFEFV